MNIRLLIISFFAITTFVACNNNQNNDNKKDTNMNPFFTEYQTPFQVPPFDEIKIEHYMPAFIEGMKQQKEEIETIINNSAKPDFDNTIAALDFSGEILTKTSDVFFNLTSSMTNEDIEAISEEISPLLSQHADDISMNAKLFERIKDVYINRDGMDLSTEQEMVLDKIYKQFVRGGANLSDEDKKKFSEINKELSLLSLKFGKNVLKETNNFQLLIDNKDDLEGLPQSIIDAAADEAKNINEEGKWLFTVQKPSMIPFLQYSAKRELREKLLKAYNSLGNNDNEFDNKQVVARIVKLRYMRAKLLGYNNHAEYVLDNNMAKTPSKVYDFLNNIWLKALPAAKKEVTELQKIVDKEKGGFDIEAWDWWYYAEKLRKEKYDLDEEQLRPYFELQNVRKGAFEVASKLYGLEFKERFDIPKYHDDAQVFEVLDEDGSHRAILYMDFFPRASKRSGAWMSSFRKQSNKNGKNITPIITIVCNFSKPSGDKPALLTYEEVTTLFHEFGHGLHGMLSECTYPRISGTSVARDFVELPSQFMENFCPEPEVLNMYAKHYKTGEIIPTELVEKINKSSHFNQGFTAVEYLSAAYLDMNWHTISDTLDYDVNKFETDALNQIGLINEIVVRYRSTYFSHVFKGGYSSGYYSYVWAELLDADAFDAFKKHGIFNKRTALAFRNNILAKGGSDDPMKLYKQFRGAEPSIDPLLKRKGFE